MAVFAVLIERSDDFDKRLPAIHLAKLLMLLRIFPRVSVNHLITIYGGGLGRVLTRMVAEILLRKVRVRFVP